MCTLTIILKLRINASILTKIGYKSLNPLLLLDAALRKIILQLLFMDKNT